MPRKTKDEIANDMYGEDYDDLLPGEKAAVTRTYNAQTSTTRSAGTSSSVVLAKIGRIGNGVEEKALRPGATVADLLRQAGFVMDEAKEGITAVSTGSPARLSDVVKAGETYILAPEIKSA